MSIFTNDIATTDPEIAGLLQKELERVTTTLQLIPSENFASRAVQNATGSIAANKYAEGYPNARYYEGNEFIDQIEILAQERVKKLFNAEYANVQPLSGGPANMCVFAAILKDGDKVLSMDLAQGGHLTHGAKVNFSGRKYDFHHYPVDPETHRINYEVVRAKAKEVMPKLIIAGASCYPREINFDIFREIADEVGAIFMADVSHIAGLIAAGVHPKVFPYADIVTTTTHKTLRGPRGAVIMARKEFGPKIDKAVFPNIQAGPHMNAICAKAVAFHEALSPAFVDYSKQVVENAVTLAEALMGFGWKLTTDGTDNHLMLIDLSKNNFDGAVASRALADAGIVTNKNMVPYDKRTPQSPSGVRLGSPAMTSRGFVTKDMTQVANWINNILTNISDQKTISTVRSEIAEYVKDLPIYPSYC